VARASEKITTRIGGGRYALPVIMYPGEDGYIIAEIAALPGCISQGKTESEALENVREAAELCLESMEEEGWELPDTFSVGQIEINISDAWTAGHFRR
jgi:predicted RNase H-like HicB family nuclease